MSTCPSTLGVPRPMPCQCHHDPCGNGEVCLNGYCAGVPLNSKVYNDYSSPEKIMFSQTFLAVCVSPRFDLSQIQPVRCFNRLSICCIYFYPTDFDWALVQPSSASRQQDSINFEVEKFLQASFFPRFFCFWSKLYNFMFDEDKTRHKIVSPRFFAYWAPPAIPLVFFPPRLVAPFPPPRGRHCQPTPVWASFWTICEILFQHFQHSKHLERHKTVLQFAFMVSLDS